MPPKHADSAATVSVVEGVSGGGSREAVEPVSDPGRGSAHPLPSRRGREVSLRCP